MSRELEQSKSVRERYILVAAIDNVIRAGVANICVVYRRMKLNNLQV